MYQLDNQKQAMDDASSRRNQAGFSLIEVVVATAVMMVVLGAVFSLLKDSMKVSMTTYELTDAQENLRTAHEFIHRDLMNTGDGLGTMSNILLPTAFVEDYITATPNAEPSAGVTTLGIVTSDDHLAPLADRITILEVDPDFTFNSLKTIPLASNAVTTSGSGSKIKIPGSGSTGMSEFTEGEVYFLSSSVGATFGTITGISGRNLEFDNDDDYGLNKGTIETIGAGTTAALWRMKIIHYYVTSAGLLKRRVFGVKGSAYHDATVAEHVKPAINYSWIETDDEGL